MLPNVPSKILSLVPLALLTSCSIPSTVRLPDLPDHLYNQAALSYTTAEGCTQYAGLSSADADYLKDYIYNRLTGYNFDSDRLYGLRQQARNELSSVMGRAGDDRARDFRINCQNLARDIAARRAQDLQDAQIIAGRAQAATARSWANAAPASPMQLQTVVPLTIAPYSPPQVMPITPPGGNQVRCIQAGIYVNCRY